MRAVLRVVAAVGLLAVCVLGHALARPFGREAIWVRCFLGGAGRLLGLRVAVEGRPLRRDVLYVCNHISWLDIMAMGGATGARFVAKAEIEGWAVAGSLARLGGAIFIRRDRRGETRVQADAVARALTEGRPVVLFAEGGTGDGRTIAPFRPALFASAVEAGITVQPVAIDYGPARADLAWPDGVGFGREARRMVERAGPVPVALRFLDPLPATLDRKALALAAREGIAGVLA